MKTYTIKINNNNNSSNGSFFTNASKNLDNLILTNMKKMNPYLNTDPDYTLDSMFDEAGFIYRDNGCLLKGNFDTEFARAAKFLANYTPKKKYFIFGDTPIEFFEDEIQIGYDLIPLSKLSNIRYYNTFTPEIKKTIINIYISINR